MRYLLGPTPTPKNGRLLRVTVILGEEAVNLNQLLYAVPVPQVGAGAALAAFFRSPAVLILDPLEQLIPGVRFTAVAQVACAIIFDFTLSIKTIASKIRWVQLVLMNRI